MLYLNKNQTVLVMDPGEHTGWVVADWNPEKCCATLSGGTAGKSHMEVAELFHIFTPTLVVFERFNLYPGLAKSLSWNSFYPCETIGVIRYLCVSKHIPIVEQAPSIKKFSGGLQQDWVVLRDKLHGTATEHTKDAYLHWKYFLRRQLALMNKQK